LDGANGLHVIIVFEKEEMHVKRLRIALIAGGLSGEREVSLKSGDAVEKALDPKKYDVKRYDPRDGLGLLLAESGNIDLALILLHGRYGEDGSMQGLLDLLGVPYVGSGILGSAMAMNKKVAKSVFRSQGLLVAEDVLLNRGEPYSSEQIRKRLGASTVVKPVSEGSSLGVTICHTEEDLFEGIDTAFRHDHEILVERFVSGKEITCCVLGNESPEALPVIEIVPNPQYNFFDYHAKYTPGATSEICPARISQAQTKDVQSCAIRAHKALYCRDWSRTDMILHKGEVYVLETNTIPGMTETSLVPLAARTAGMSFSQLVDRLIGLCMERVRT
jgi:D-alanine-D-alanine ligase